MTIENVIRNARRTENDVQVQHLSDETWSKCCKVDLPKLNGIIGSNYQGTCTCIKWAGEWDHWDLNKRPR